MAFGSFNVMSAEPAMAITKHTFCLKNAVNRVTKGWQGKAQI